MARAEYNPGGPKFRGRLKGLIFYNRNDKSFVRTHGERDPNLPWSQEQLSQQKSFKEAVAYAKSVQADPDKAAVYEAAARDEHRDVYHLAISDAMGSPVFGGVDASQYFGEAGQTILVYASDNHGVVRVHVSIQDPSGRLIEEGRAEPVFGEKGGGWAYRTTTSVATGVAGVVILVVIADSPGNEAVAQTDHLLRRDG